MYVFIYMCVSHMHVYYFTGKKEQNWQLMHCTACKEFWLPASFSPSLQRHARNSTGKQRKLRTHSSIILSRALRRVSSPPLARSTCLHHLPCSRRRGSRCSRPLRFESSPAPVSLLHLGLVCLLLLRLWSADHFVFFVGSWWCSVFHDPRLFPLWLICFLFSKSTAVVPVCLDLPPCLLFPLLVCRS
jgi:hypothetical protein